MKPTQKLIEACEALDEAIFNDAVANNADDSIMLDYYLKRWLREIPKQEDLKSRRDNNCL